MLPGTGEIGFIISFCRGDGAIDGFLGLGSVTRVHTSTALVSDPFLWQSAARVLGVVFLIHVMSWVDTFFRKKISVVREGFWNGPGLGTLDV